MDRFKISGQELCQHYPNGTVLAEVFGDIERELKEIQQVVCQFIVNGVPLKEEDEVKFSKIPLTDITSLEYLTEKTQNLVEGVLRGWIDALPEMIKKCEILSRRMKSEASQERIKDVRELVDNCQFLVSSIISLKGVLGDSVMAGIDKWSTAEEKTQSCLKEAVLAFEKKDFALLADVIDYDLNHGLQLWLEILRRVESIYTGRPIPTEKPAGSHSVDRKDLSN